jgi:phospholipid/cholesterol/gamma-HCH transport system substrate-binding protein
VRGSSRATLYNGLWVLAMIAVALVVGAYITSHQRIHIPAWVPGIGQHRFFLDAELSAAPGVMPGQGQMVTVSGVPVGEISKVSLKNGKAVLRLAIKERYAHIHRDATILLRPKTGLKDMVAELDPGTKGPELKSNATIGTGSTKPDVNFDEFLAELDADTRDSLVLLVGGAGTAIGKGNGDDFANVLRRFEPLSRHGAKATELVAQRRTKLKRLMHNLSLLASELGERDKQLGTFVNASNDVFRRFDNQNAALAKSLELLPGTLQTAQPAFAKLDKLGATLTDGLKKLGPGVKDLGPTLVDFGTFAKQTTPVVRDQIRPFTREAQPTAKKLVPAAQRLAKATPDLARLTDELNVLVNELAFKPKGKGIKNQSYLYQVPWASHNTNSVLANSDGVGPLRRGLVYFGCGPLNLLFNVLSGPPKGKTEPRNPTLTTLIKLLNAPDHGSLVASGQCPKEATG